MTIHTLKKELIPDNSHRGLCSQLPVGLLLSYDHNPELQRDEKISAVRGSESSRGEVMATGRTEGLCSEERLKVTPNLRGCLPEKNSNARCFLRNHHKLYIDRKVIESAFFSRPREKWHMMEKCLS